LVEDLLKQKLELLENKKKRMKKKHLHKKWHKAIEIAKHNLEAKKES
jgi:hypothetical protein